MSNIIISKNKIPATVGKDLELVNTFEKIISQAPQTTLTTWHTLHGGVYTRTILVPKDVIITSANIKIPTTLTISGRALIILGGKVKEVKGYGSLPASAGRKQVIRALEDTYLTMTFKTEAKTIKEAEEEFTDDADKLISRLPTATNIINNTGE